MTFGVVAGITRAVGFLRWVFSVPSLAERAAPPSTRTAEVVVFEATHQLAQIAVGENIAFICQGFWMLLLGRATVHHRGFDRRHAWVGVGLGLGFMVYALE